MTPILVMWTCASADEAERVGRLLVEQRLVACCNVLPGLTSLFCWKDHLETAEETKVFLKTRRCHFEAIETLILREGSYEVPDVTYVEITGGHQPYLKWIEKNTPPEGGV